MSAVTLERTAIAGLRAHQTDALDAAAGKPAFMLAMPMGLGKSAVAINLLDLTDAQRVLVLCPKNVVGVWPSQFNGPLDPPAPDGWSPRNWHVWAGEVQGARGPLRNPSITRRAEAIFGAVHLATHRDHPLAVVVNQEACWQGDLGTLLAVLDWDAIVLDESHRLKAPGGKASRFAARICARTRQRGGQVLALTGTPMPHTPLDLYGQFRAIDPTVLGTSYARFRQRYGAPKVLYRTGDGEPVYAVTPAGQTIYEGVREDRLDELTDRVRPLMFQCDDDVLGLDEPTDTFRTCELGAQARRVYDRLERDSIAEVDNGTVTAANAMVLVLRLAQATSGFARDVDTGRDLQVGDEKAALLADVLCDLPRREPIVVFCRFHTDLDAVRRVSEEQGRRYAELSGRRRDGLTAEATMSADCDVLGAQIKSGSVGISLVRARVGIYYSLGFELSDYLQSRARLVRQGQTRPVTFLHLVAQSTVDRAIYGALRRRESVVNAVMDRLKRAGL